MSLRPLLRCLPFAAIVLVAACSERLETGANCPVLCTNNAAVFKDTTFDVVTYDSAFAGFTGDGERWLAPAIPSSDGTSFVYETYVPVINRRDSVDVRQVFRFDTLPKTFSASDTTPITAVTDSKLLLVVDTARSVIPVGVTTVSVYDVDDSTATDDTLATLLTPRFVPGRLLTQRTFTRAQLVADTINGAGSGTIRALTVTIPDSTMLKFIRRGRMRLGVQASAGTSVALSIVSPRVNSSSLVPRLTYDPSPDTAVKAWAVNTKYQPTATTSDDRFRSQSLVLKNTTPVLNDGSLEVGGLVGSRSLLKLKLPRTFLDTVTVVRASLDLTQRPLRTIPGATDGVRVRLRLGIAGPALGTDPRRVVEFLDPTLEGLPPLPSVRIVPSDSGVRSFDVLSAIRRWQSQDSTFATNFVLYGEGETFQEQRPAFYSRRNPNPAVRPRLRVTYTLRREGAIP